jgi:hypothetical protein
MLVQTGRGKNVDAVGHASSSDRWSVHHDADSVGHAIVPPQFSILINPFKLMSAGLNKSRIDIASRRMIARFVAARHGRDSGLP